MINVKTMCQIIIGVVITPIIIPLLFVKGLTEHCPRYIHYIKYKINNEKYVKYKNIPYLARPKFDNIYYDSYKDKIAIIQDNKMCFAYKHIDTQTNKIVYITENNEIIDVDLEQYKIK